MRSFRLLSLAFALTLGIPACSSDSGDDDSSPSEQSGTEQPGTASAELTAAEGGELELGGASLSIPGGALADDTTVTVESKKPSASLPDATSLTGLVYDFGPSGTTFEKPVALTLPLAKAPGAGKEAVIAYLDESSGSWEDLATTTDGSGAVSAEIMHFSTYVVRIRNTNVDMNPGEVDCSFTACGGDPTGTWQIATACITGDSSGSPFGDQCAEGTIDIDIMADGTLTVAGGRYDWNLSVTGNVTFNIPASCVDPLSGGAATSCNDFAGDDPDTTCKGSLSSGCACTQAGETSTDTSSGTLEVRGNQVIGTQDGEQPGEPSDFCVKGNSLKLMMHETADDGSVQNILLAFTK